MYYRTKSAAGVAAKLTLVTNVFRKPWLSNEFGRAVQQALAELVQVMSPTHPFFLEHADEIIADLGDPHADPYSAFKRSCELPGYYRRRGWVKLNVDP